MNRRKFLATSGATLASAAAINPLQAIAESDKRQIPGYGSLDANPQPITTSSNDLTEYSGTWGDRQIRHLLRRSTFGAKYSAFSAAQALGSMNAVVSKILEDTPLPPKPADWAEKNYIPDRNSTQTEFQNLQRFNKYLEWSLQDWWLDLMMKEDLSIREKLTLMWSNHFVTGWDSVHFSGYMYEYSQMLRRNAMGNMKTMVSEMAVDGAMLIYLNGNQNTYQVKNGKTINNVNENFARELMELFTLGLLDPKTGEANYTETDIQQAAKALSGWQPATTYPFTGVLNAQLHNNETKTFFGQTGNFGMQDIINMIFAKGGGYNTAYFLCQKIYTTFVYWVPNTGVIDAMANKLIASNWELKPVLDALLKSAHFYDSEVIGAQLKSPAELFCSLIREFNLTVPAYNPAEPVDTGKVDAMGYTVWQDNNPTHTYLIVAMGNALGQDLLNPPNVKGWAGGHAWVNTGSYPTRKTLAFGSVQFPNIYNGSGRNAKGVVIGFDPMAWAKLIPNAETLSSSELANALSDAVLAFDLGPLESETIRSVLANGVPEVDYYLDGTNASHAAQVLATFPEFQLF
jgi:uncharacterized protein (DUF1800 family)